MCVACRAALSATTPRVGTSLPPRTELRWRERMCPASVVPRITSLCTLLKLDLSKGTTACGDARSVTWAAPMRSVHDHRRLDSCHLRSLSGKGRTQGRASPKDFYRQRPWRPSAALPIAPRAQKVRGRQQTYTSPSAHSKRSALPTGRRLGAKWAAGGRRAAIPAP